MIDGNDEYPDFKTMSIKEFRQLGYLQEVNRLFLHPLGLALEVLVHADGREELSRICDGRGDPEGVLYAEGTIDPDKVAFINYERTRRLPERVALTGSWIQHVDICECDACEEEDIFGGHPWLMFQPGIMIADAPYGAPVVQALGPDKDGKCMDCTIRKATRAGQCDFCRRHGHHG